VELLVQLLQVWSAWSVKARPSGLRARENIVLVRRISDTFMHVAFFVQGRNLVYAIAKAPALKCVAVQLR
jgi:hypothetical protein